jgi:hypothetical protein
VTSEYYSLSFVFSQAAKGSLQHMQSDTIDFIHFSLSRRLFYMCQCQCAQGLPRTHRAFARLARYYDDQLAQQQQEADRLRRTIAEDMVAFRNTNQAHIVAMWTPLLKCLTVLTQFGIVPQDALRDW